MNRQKDLLFYLKCRWVLRRYAQFCIVGGTGVLVDMAALWLFSSPAILGWHLSLSKVIAAELGLINNFVWNEMWTFRELAAEREGRRQRSGRFIKFNVICMAGIALSVLLLNAQVHGVGWNAYLANFNAIVVASVWNFF